MSVRSWSTASFIPVADFDEISYCLFNDTVFLISKETVPSTGKQDPYQHIGL
jgi:hypothetical protein